MLQNQGGNTLDLIRAFLVVGEAFPCILQDAGDQLHGGGFAVAAGDGDNIGGHFDFTQNIRVEL